MSYVLDPDCSFSGVQFIAEETGDLARATFPTVRTLSVRKVPYGSRTIVQDLGAEAAPVAYTITLLKADLAALRAKVGTTGTLAILGEAARSGVLLQTIGTPVVDDINGLATLQVTFLAVA